jgi:hypothetical protein
MPREPASVSQTVPDLIYDAFYSGAIGGSVVALFFLLVDVLNGQPLFTPSLMGSVLFAGVSAEAVTEVRLDRVAWYSVVHFGAFGALGLGIAFLVREVELHSRHPALLFALLFGVFEVGFLLAAWLLLPGVVARLGAPMVGLANLLAAGAMALFLLATHRPGLWQRLRHSAHRA